MPSVSFSRVTASDHDSTRSHSMTARFSVTRFFLSTMVGSV